MSNCPVIRNNFRHFEALNNMCRLPGRATVALDPRIVVNSTELLIVLSALAFNVTRDFKLASTVGGDDHARGGRSATDSATLPVCMNRTSQDTALPENYLASPDGCINVSRSKIYFYPDLSPGWNFITFDRCRILPILLNYSYF
jgi:hypothetical protein